MKLLKVGKILNFSLIIFFLGLIIIKTLCKLEIGINNENLVIGYCLISGVIILSLLIISFNYRKSSDL